MFTFPNFELEKNGEQIIVPRLEGLGGKLKMANKYESGSVCNVTDFAQSYMQNLTASCEA
jgi:hypothetical protein